MWLCFHGVVISNFIPTWDRCFCWYKLLPSTNSENTVENFLYWYEFLFFALYWCEVRGVEYFVGRSWTMDWSAFGFRVSGYVNNFRIGREEVFSGTNWARVHVSFAILNILKMISSVWWSTGNFLMAVLECEDEKNKDEEAGSKSCREVVESFWYADIAMDAYQVCLTGICKDFLILTVFFPILKFDIVLLLCRCFW